MSVLIKGMKMPEKCGSCELFHVELPMHCTVVKGHKTVGAPYGMPRPDWCPLVEIPEPHGRLIDADAPKETLDYYICEANWGDEVNKGLRWVKDDFINSENTVIEAADEYAENEKAQLSCEGTTKDATSDPISRQAARHALCKAVHKDEDIPCDNQTGSCLWTGTRVCDYVREIDALPSVQTEPSIPLSWIEKHIEWHKSLDNIFAELIISGMVKKWSDEQGESN